MTQVRAFVGLFLFFKGIYAIQLLKEVYKMRKIRIVWWLVLASVAIGLLVPGAFAADAPGRVVVSDATGNAGETVEVVVRVEDNPGIISMALNVYYDRDKLALIKVEDGRLLPDSMFSESYASYPYYAGWLDALATQDNVENGVLMVLTFKIADDCESGNTDISVAVKQQDIFDHDFNEKAFVTETGTVIISGKDETSSGGGGSSSGGGGGSSGSGASGGGSSKENGSSSDGKDEADENIPEEEVGSRYDDFADLDPNGWYRSYVEYMLENKYMDGISDSCFDPDGTVTRAQLVTILYRIAGAPTTAGLSNPFTDVKGGSWYYDAVVWAAAGGIVNGVTDDHFAPDSNITREQLAVILYRCSGASSPAENALNAYSDKGDISSYAVDAMKGAGGSNIMNGLSETRLAPGATATRAQAAAMLVRYVENETIIPVPTDPTASDS